MHRRPAFRPKHIIGPEIQWQRKRFVAVGVLRTYDIAESFHPGKVFVTTGFLTRSRKGIEVWLMRRQGKDFVIDYSRTYWVRALDLRDSNLVQGFLPRHVIKELIRKFELQFSLLTPAR